MRGQVSPDVDGIPAGGSIRPHRSDRPYRHEDGCPLKRCSVKKVRRNGIFRKFVD